MPWQYLPTGRAYRRLPNDPIPGLSNQAYNDQGQLDVLLQRHYLQTGFTDLQLQRLWDKLKREGMWDDSLIVVAADHGVAFPLGSRQRRRLSEDTAAEIAPIPLLIKAPGQRRGRVDDAYVETIDILPTMFDLLNLDPNVEFDGKSAFSDEVQDRDELRFLIRNTFKTLRIPADEFERSRQEIIERNLGLFGTGRDGPERLYLIGPNRELVGQPATAAGEKLDVDLSYAERVPQRGPGVGLRADARGRDRERRRHDQAQHRGRRERDDRGGGQHLQARRGRRGRAGLGDGARVGVPGGAQHRRGLRDRVAKNLRAQPAEPAACG